MGRTRARLCALLACLMLGIVGSPGLAVAAAKPVLDVTVVFDKGTYHTGELINAEFTVRNAGTERVTALRVGTNFNDNDDELVVEPRQWGDFTQFADPMNPGVTLEPGESRTVKLSGRIHRAESETVILSGGLFTDADPINSLTDFVASASVTKTYGTASGVVFADRNNNGTSDPGEQLPNATVSWAYAENWKDVYKTTADSDGRFTFAQIPTVRYTTNNTTTDGWVVLSTSVLVEADAKNADLRLRAVTPLNGELQPDLKFTKDTYQPGELAHVTVTLVNSSKFPLTGIIATCNRGRGLRNVLNGTGPGWDRLTTGNGVTLPPGQTTFDVAEAVPQDAVAYGFVAAQCDFGYAGMDLLETNPVGRGVANVPGGVGGIQAELAFYPEGNTAGAPKQPVAGVKVVVVDQRRCRLAEKPTDANGVVAFSDLPAGPNGYSLYFFPPTGWTLLAENPQTAISVYANTTSSRGYDVGKGNSPLPVLPAQSAECGASGTQPPADQPPSSRPPTSRPPSTQPPVKQPPAEVTPQPKAVAKLANTGADVRVPALVGLLALVMGIGLIVATRRRGAKPD